MLKKRALITITSCKDNEADSAIEVVSPGEFERKEDFYLAVYDETEISGMQGTKTSLMIGLENLTLLRVGTTNAEMKFKKDNKEITLYNTPYGVIEMKIETKDLKINMSENGGEVLVNYSLAIAGEKPQNTTLKVNIKA